MRLTIAAWRGLPMPESSWRTVARRAIRSATDGLDLAVMPEMEIRMRVEGAYPLTARRGYAYKMWLYERDLFLVALAGGTGTTPTTDEADACDVARDLVEMGRMDEAIALLDDQAPNRLALRCPACGARPSTACSEFDQESTMTIANSDGWHRDLVVPHAARLTARIDAHAFIGPLYRGGGVDNP